MAAATQAVGNLPSGTGVCTTFPELFYVPELIFGGLVWTLVASTYVAPANPQGWVMFVSVFCFTFTTVWFFIFICGGNQSSIWPGLDTAYHFIAVLFYLSASVVLAYLTILIKIAHNSTTPNPIVFKVYQEDISAVVMAFVATLLYFIHAILSALRWKMLQPSPVQPI